MEESYAIKNSMVENDFCSYQKTPTPSSHQQIGGGPLFLFGQASFISPTD